MPDPKLYDDTAPWVLDRVMRVQPPLFAAGSKRCTEIVATVFGGVADPNTSAYDEHVITDEELGVALPIRFKVPPAAARARFQWQGLSRLRDRRCRAVEHRRSLLGKRRAGRRRKPASTGAGARPMAPASISPQRRPRRWGIPGKGKVDWEFIAPDKLAAAEKKVAEAVDEQGVLLQEVLTLLQRIEKLPALPQSPEHLRRFVEVTGAVDILDAAGAPAADQVTAKASAACRRRRSSGSCERNSSNSPLSGCWKLSR